MVGVHAGAQLCTETSNTSHNPLTPERSGVNTPACTHTYLLALLAPHLCNLCQHQRALRARSSMSSDKVNVVNVRLVRQERLRMEERAHAWLECTHMCRHFSM